MRNLSKYFLYFTMLMLLSCSVEETSTTPPPPGALLSAPTEVTATAGNGQVALQWKAVSGASSYNIYWSESTGVSPATGKKITESSNSYIHKGLTNGATYYYVITAANASGESSGSVEVAITLNDAPTAPIGVAAISGDRQARIYWRPAEKATGYNIYWSSESGTGLNKRTRIMNVSSPYTHAGLTNGSHYYYVVTAVNADGESSASLEASATPRTDPDNARFRVVWVQDTGEGSDSFATGNALRLMGMDSKDGQGERVLLGVVGNYSKPLITPGGERVVYTDRIRKRINIVNWDGSGQRDLFGGFGLALWRDPGDGRVWIYYGLTETADEHCPAVYRTPLDSPGAGELVWNRTPVSVDSFQISADGRIAGGNFPWPAGGIAQLPNQSWTKLGSGCWASLAPDNSYLFWLLDDSHRNLYISDRFGENGRSVNINNAPGIDGYEIYHPRWSNHPLIMAMTGPYRVGSGNNRIAGGGRAVEIYIGRFNADMTAITSWWQITNNDMGDFFPDVWVSP